jgi:hypothetical protein
MPSVTKNKVKSKKAILGGVVDKSVGSYEKHPFFVKKANEAKALIKKVGLPKELTGKK